MASLAYKPEPKSLLSEATEMAEDDAVAAIADRQRQQLQYERKLRKVFLWAVMVIVLVSAAAIAAYRLLG
jgi:hypothetical protein